MNKEERKANELEENEEVKEMVVSEENENNGELMVQDFSELKHKSKTIRKIYTNITDKKKIFNLENKVDEKIINCKNEKIRVQEVLIKIIEKELEEDLINEETGEVIKSKGEIDRKMITILIDESNRSYVTASKSFTMNMINYIEMFGIEEVEGLEIKIIEKPVKDTGHKTLSFEIL